MKVQSFCDLPFNRLRVDCEGFAYMCCAQRPDEREDKRKHAIGNLLECGFEEVWNGDAAVKIREATLNQTLHSKCQVKGCPYYHGKHLEDHVEDVIYDLYPESLEIDLPNIHCNVGLEQPNPDRPACIMCERASPGFQPEKDRLDDVLRVIRPFVSHLKHVHIQGIAEPFFKNKLFEILDILQINGQSQTIHVSTTTNATIFGKTIRSRYLDLCSKSTTVFSVDASSAKTFEKIRILPLFRQVTKNIYDFCRERDARHQSTIIHNNINVHNVHEVADMVKLGHDLGVDQIHFSPTAGWNNSLLVSHHNAGQFHKAERHAKEMSEKLNIPVKFLKPLDQGLTNQLVQLSL